MLPKQSTAAASTTGWWRSGFKGLDVQSTVALAGAVLLALASAAIIVSVVQLRNDALEDARRNIGNLGIVLAEQTSRSVEIVDLVLRDLQDTIRQRNGDTARSFSQAVMGEPFRQKMAELIARLPQANIFAVIDSKGLIENASRDVPAGRNLSDREYFKYLSSYNDPDLFIGAPSFNTVTGSWNINFARRISSRAGEFLGVVICGVPIKYFEDIFKSIDLSNKETFLLARRDGTVLVRQPDPTPRTGETIPATALWYKIVAEGGGYYESPGYFDGITRIVAVHPLADYPLVMDSTVDKAAALATWQSRALTTIAGSILLLAFASFLMLVTHDQFTRLKTIGGSLLRQNEDLKQLSQELENGKEHLAELTEELQMTLETMDQGLMLIDAHGVVVQCNPQAARNLNLPVDLMASRPQFSAVLEHQWSTDHSVYEEKTLEEFMSNRITGDRAYSQELRRPDGRVLEMRSIPMAAGGFVRTYTDITDRKIVEERVNYLAHHDDLTCLVNRVAFRDCLQDAMTTAQESGHGTALLYLDLDRFKQVNDTRGHNVGDLVLAEAARRMQASVRGNDTVARLGGDEFAIILPSLDDPGVAERLAKRLVAEMAKPFDVDGEPVFVGVSIGIAIHPNDGPSVDALLAHADAALYEAKHAGRGTYCFHHSPEIAA